MSSRRGPRRAWIFSLALAYGVFFVWYGGSGAPLSEPEGRAFLEMIRTSSAATEHPEMLEGLEGWIARDDGREFVMANLITMKPGPEAEKEDAAYGRALMPLMLRRASFPIYIGDVRARLLGDDAMAINRVAIVRYRSLRDFLVIFSDPVMLDGVSHKFAALSYTEARATTPFLSLVTIRLTVALGVLLIGAAGWIALGGRRDRRGARLA